MELILYSDYACPFCYLASITVVELQRHFGGSVEFDIRAFELRPAPQPLIDQNEPRIRSAWEQGVMRLATERGVAIRRPSISPRTRKAHELAQWARSKGAFESIHAALFGALWLENRDIGRIDVLVDIAVSQGLDRSEAKVDLDIDQFTNDVENQERAALELGVGGVPAFIHGKERIEGAQPFDVLERWISLQLES